MSPSLFPVDPSDECIGCNGTPLDRDTILTYHHSDPYDRHFQSGYLCMFCEQQIEAILDGDRETDCEWCGAPLPEAHRRVVMEFDENDTLHDTLTLCKNCVQSSY